MAPQPARFAKRSSGTSAVLATASARGDSDEETQSIPLVLRPLLEPYRGHERVTLRVERVPQRARLSAGQNNGDQSWSLALDELDDLVYLLPTDITDAHSLAIRVISRTDGGTVALLNYRISPGEAASDAAPRPAATPPAIPSPSNTAELMALRGELAQAKAALAAGDAKASERLEQTEQEWTERARDLVDKALAKARAEWDAEFSGRLKAVSERAEQALVSRRAAWQAELDTFVSASERRAEEEKARARDGWKRDADAALAKAQDTWRAEEAARFAAAEARWRNEAASAQADARNHAVRNQRDAEELGRLRNLLTATEKSVGDRARELDEARAQYGRAQETWQRETEAALAGAKKVWTTEESARLAAAELRWREQSAVTLAAAVARQERAEKALDETVRRAALQADKRDEGERSQTDEVAALRSALAATQVALADAREQVRGEVEARLVEAKDHWKLEEDSRLSAAEGRIREHVAAALTEATAQRERAERALADAREQARILSAQHEDAKHLDLQGQNKTLQSALESRDAELKQAREQARTGSEAALAQARRDWTAEEASRLQAAQARWEADSEKRLQEANRRCQVAEQQLAEARVQREANPRDRIEILRLRDELEKLKINLDVRDIELRQSRSSFGLMAQSEGESVQALPPLKRNRMAMRGDPAKAEEKRKKGRAIIRDVVLVALAVFLMALAPLLRPTVEPLLPYDWQDELDSTFGDLAPPAATSNVPSKPQPVPPPVVQAPSPAIVVRAAKLHADPSKTSPVLATLAPDTQVVPLERQGGWVRVSVAGQSNGEKGWVYESYLAGITDPDHAAPDGGR